MIVLCVKSSKGLHFTICAGYSVANELKVCAIFAFFFIVSTTETAEMDFSSLQEIEIDEKGLIKLMEQTVSNIYDKTKLM